MKWYASTVDDFLIGFSAPAFASFFGFA